jgi:hypothetical protein
MIKHRLNGLPAGTTCVLVFFFGEALATGFLRLRAIAQDLMPLGEEWYGVMPQSLQETPGWKTLAGGLRWRSWWICRMELSR